MVLAPRTCWRANPDPDDEAIKYALRGNLCRCTGYNTITKAVRAAAQARREVTA